MKHFPLAIVILLVAGALWFLLGTNERGPGSRASAPLPEVEEPNAPVALQAAEAAKAVEATDAATEPAELEPSTEPARVAVDRVEREVGAPHAVASAELPASVRVLVQHTATGAPIPDLNVVVWAMATERSTTVFTTDATGSATRKNAPTGVQLDLIVQTADGSRELHRAELEPLVPGEQRELTVQLDEVPADTYWFRVVSRADDTPVAGARFLDASPSRWEPRKDQDEWTQLGVSDGAGLVELPARSQHDSLLVEAEGFAPALIGLASGGLSANLPTAVALYRPARLEVQLVDEGGAQVVGRRIVVHEPNYRQDEEGRFGAAVPDPSDAFHFEATTDSAGLARIEGLPTLTGYESTFGGAGTQLQVSLLAEAPEGQESNGSPAFTDLLPGGLRLEPGEVRELVVPVGGGSRVHGVVVDQRDTPVADVELWLLRAGPIARAMAWEVMGEPLERTARADAAGRFDLGRVPVGRWELFVAPPPDAPGQSFMEEFTVPTTESLAAAVADTYVAFEVDGRESALELHLETARGLFLEGSVLDPEGEPAAGVLVIAFSPQPRHGAQTLTGAAGAFRIGPLRDAEYQVEADMTADGAVRARPGDRVTLRRARPGELRGRLVGEPDPLPSPVHTQCLSSSLGAGFGRDASTAMKPEFQFESLVPGEYSLTASTSDGRFAVASGLRVEPGKTTGPVPLRLEHGCRVSVSVALSSASHCLVVLRAGLAPVGARVGSTLETYELLGPPGPAVVELWIDRELRASREVVLVAGEEVDVELREP